ncbi:hypothetical protein [Streptomyces lydicus]
MLDDFEIDAEFGGVFHGVSFVAVVGPGFGDGGVWAILARSWMLAVES